MFKQITIPVGATLRRASALPNVLPLLGVLLTLAFVVYPDMARDLWTDEAFTVSYTAHPTLSALLDDVRKNEETPPLYFVVSWLWARGFGQSEEALRTLSLLCGALAVGLFARFAQRHLPARAAFAAVTILALSPLLQRYMVEARGYTLTMLLAVVCIAAYERLWRAPDSPWAQVGYTLSAVVLFYSSYFSVVILGAQWLLWLGQLRAPATRRQRLRAWGLMHLAVAVLVLPWLPSLAYQARVAPAVTASWSNGPQDYFYMACAVLLGKPASGAWFLLWQLGAAAGFALMLATALRPRAGIGGLALRTLAVPGALLLAMSLLLQVTALRYLIVLLPSAALVAAAGFEALRERRPPLAWGLAVLLALGLLGSIRAPWTQPSPANPWATLSAEVARQADPAGDVVIFHPPWDQRIFEYYYGGPPLPLLGVHHYDDFYYTQGYSLKQTWRSEEAIPLLAPHQRVWVFYNQMFHGVPPLALPYRELGRWREGKLELILYEVRAP